MKRLTYTIMIAMALPINAQRPMSLDDCLKAAETSNLTLRSDRIAIERAKDLQATAFDLDKTSISLAQTPTTGGGPENALTFSQAFEFPTIYGVRKSKLKAETRVEEARYEVDKNELKREVASAYCSLAYALEMKRMLAVQDSVYSRFMQIAEARYRAGESGALERMNARRLYEENRMAMATADKQADNAQLTLGRWLNTDERIIPAEATFKVIDVAMNDFNPQNAPSVLLSTSENEVAEKKLRLARQSFLPDISLGASTQLVISGWNPYNVDRSRFSEGNLMGFEVGISVPIFYGAKRANVKAAKKEVEQSRLRMEEQLKNATTDYAIAQNEYAKAKERLEYYQAKGNSDAAETCRIAQLAYEKGDIEYVEYIQNLQSALALQLASTGAINEYNQALIKLFFRL